MRKNSKGFTLLELLVVIGLIALLAAVVIVALGRSREKGVDGSIKANLRTIRSQAELFYVNNNNSYMASSGTGQTLYLNYCNDPYWATNVSRSIFVSDPTIKNALAEALKRAGATSTLHSRCANSSTAWAVAIKLKSSFGAWCVDSTGQNKVFSGFIGSAIEYPSFKCR